MSEDILDLNSLTETKEVEANELPDELSIIKAEKEALETELTALKAQLLAHEEENRATARMNIEISEFKTYFPELDLTEIPEHIWEHVRKGANLSASFALHLRKNELERERIDGFNKKNRQLSAGSIISHEDGGYYSRSEVMKMSREQVRAHYDDIVESMRHWN